jgi:hypothetical protein
MVPPCCQAIRIEEVGELADLDKCWHLAYDDCSHGQAFAREGLEDPKRPWWRRPTQCVSGLRPGAYVQRSVPQRAIRRLRDKKPPHSFTIGTAIPVPQRAHVLLAGAVEQ